MVKGQLLILVALSVILVLLFICVFMILYNKYLKEDISFLVERNLRVFCFQKAHQEALDCFQERIGNVMATAKQKEATKVLLKKLEKSFRSMRKAHTRRGLLRNELKWKKSVRPALEMLGFAPSEIKKLMTGG